MLNSKKHILLGVVGLGLAIFCTQAKAETQSVLEARAGLMRHNVCFVDCKNANKEAGANFHVELVFKSPGVFKRVFRPRPYVMASANTSGATSFAGAGLHWSIALTDTIKLEPGFGYVIHNGAKEPPYPQFDSRNVTFAEENLLLGSSDLFRTSLSLGYTLNPKIGVQLTYEHLSHGYILGDGHNQGLDNIGIRLGKKF